MPDTRRRLERDARSCPECQKALSFVASWTFRGLWGYNEVRTYECPEHGPIFVSTPALPSMSFGKGRDRTPQTGDRDSLVAVPREPNPTLDAGAIAIPEPESET